MRDWINAVLVEQDFTDNVAAIAAVIESELDNYSGCDHGAAEGAAYEITTMPNPTYEEIRETIKRIDSYNPYEGFELGSIDAAAQMVCQMMRIPVS